GRGQLSEGNGAGDDALEMPRAQVAGDALPHGEAHVAPRRRGVDAEQRNPAQDEGHHRGGELSPGGETDTGDVPPEVDRAREPAEGLATEIVDRATEAHILERP